MKAEYYNYIANFECLADKCPNSCCQAWKMQIDDRTLRLYKDKAPELLESVDLDNMAMRREQNNFCVRLTDEGLCGIHKQYGSNFLSDACSLYPRVIRRSDETLIGAGSLSCPKVVSDLLTADKPFDLQPSNADRIPSNITQVEHSKLRLQEILLFKLEESSSALIFMQKLVFIASMLDNVNVAQWPALVDSLIDDVHPTLFVKSEDKLAMLKILNTFVIMAKASGKATDHYILQIVNNVAQVMKLEVDWANLSISVLDQEAYNLALHNINSSNSEVDNILKRFLGGQLALTITSNKMSAGAAYQQVSLIYYKFILSAFFIKLFHIHDKERVLQDIAIEIIYIVSRVLDHLADHQLILEVLKSFELDKAEAIIGLLDWLGHSSVAPAS
jgi:hypothetical protein